MDLTLNSSKGERAILLPSKHRAAFFGKSLLRFPMIFGKPQINERVGREVVRFVGGCVAPPLVCLVMEVCDSSVHP